MNKLSVIGLGKLGVCSAACFASKGFDVIGVDINKRFVDAVNNGIAPVYEPGLQELMDSSRDRLRATQDYDEAIRSSDITFLIVPTPSRGDGDFSDRHLKDALLSLSSALVNISKKYHIFVIVSTVSPGTVEESLIPLIESTSGKKLNKDFGVAYNPDFIALGSIISDFLNPDMIIIGESDDKVGSILEGIHRDLVDNRPNIHRMNMYNAELAKISLNAYCTVKITFANVLAEICEKMPGGDAEVLTNALGDDTRIGHKYLKGGLSYGGPCFPRDNRAFAFSAAKFGTRNVLAGKTDEINDYQRNERIPQKITEILEEKKTSKLAVLGLTYKKDTTLVEESAAISIIKSLSTKGVSFTVYDPAGMEEAKIVFKDLRNIKYANSAMECINGNTVCFIATPWDEFGKLTVDDFLRSMRTPTIFDACNIYSFTKDDGIDYRQIGKGSNKLQS